MKYKFPIDLKNIHLNRLFNIGRFEYFYIIDVETHCIKIFLVRSRLNEEQNADTSVIDVSKRIFYQDSDFTSDKKDLFISLGNQIRQQVKDLHKRNRFIEVKNLYFNVSMHLAYSEKNSYFYKRDNPNTHIDEGESLNILQNIQTKALDNTRRTFIKKFKIPKTDIVILNSFTSDIDIDGKKYEEIVGIKGNHITIELLNVFIPAYYNKLFRFIEQEIGCDGIYFYEPYLFTIKLASLAQSPGNALLISVKRKSGYISLMKKNEFEISRSIDFGYDRLVKKIAKLFRCSYSFAEDIIQNYANGVIDKKGEGIIIESLSSEVDIFLNEIEKFLKECSTKGLIPHTIYLHTPNNILSIFNDIIENKRWIKQQLFKNDLVIKHFLKDDFTTSVNLNILSNNSDSFIPARVVCDFVESIKETQYRQFNKDLKRINNLIQ